MPLCLLLMMIDDEHKVLLIAGVDESSLIFFGYFKRDRVKHEFCK